MTKSLSAEKTAWIEKAHLAFDLRDKQFTDEFTREKHLINRAEIMLSVFNAKVGDEVYDVTTDKFTIWSE